MTLRIICFLSMFCLAIPTQIRAADEPKAVFRAGAAMVDITPVVFPVRVNGMVEERTATMAHDVLMSRALVMDDGEERIVVVIVDSLMLTRAMLDDVKEQATQQTGIPTDHMLIAATHSHSAPSAMPCLGSRTDPEYAQFLPGQIVRSIVQANEKLVPAQFGWAVTGDDQHNHCRRWIFRSDRMTMADPFGQHNVRAHMHPGYQSPNHIGPSGPADTDFTLLSVRTLNEEPIAVLANYAMHYYGSPLVSGDVCGRFGFKFAELIGVANQQPGFVGILSQGTSGDGMWMDYSQPPKPNDLDAYTKALAEVALRAYKSIHHRSDITLAMAETMLKLNRRVPDESRLKWAQDLVAEVGDRLPRGWSEVYAFEQLHLHEDPTAELKLQAIRIGDFGITAIPDEVYGITGIKLKNQSPLAATMNIELANGAEGYIPPPEQHKLGGYTTWAARTAGLEEQTEPQIVETLTRLLELVSKKLRRPSIDQEHKYSKSVVESKPKAFWRLGEIGTVDPSLRRRESAGAIPIDDAEVPAVGAAGVQYAADVIGNYQGVYEDGVAFYLPGPQGNGLKQLTDTPNPRGNRAAHFAGGRVVAKVPELGNVYSVECWIWNGFPNDDRAVTGYFFSHGPAGDPKVAGDHLGIGGNYENKGWNGRLLLFNGNERDEALIGRTVLETRTWHHVVFTRNDNHVTVFLNGKPEPEIDGELEPTYSADCDEFFLGGRSDRLLGLEGRLDEVALYDRALTADEVATHFAMAEAVLVPQVTEAVPQPDSLPLSPEESMKVTHLPEGYELRLVAAEPLVMDPVAIDWGSDGKLWVAEMADYPSGMDNNGKPGGRIRFLEDKIEDPDGVYDTSTVFLSDIPFPTGVMAWGKGVLITAAPELIYAEDTDGDGKADVRKTLYSGFLEGNQQLRVNGLRWGLDNWVYCASGSHHPGYGADNQILSLITNEKTAVGSRDFRIRPNEGLIDPQSGPSQFGRNRDPWGNWFGEQNSYPLWHYVLEDQYIRRNPHFAPPDPRHLLTPSNPPVFSAAPPEKRFHSFEQSGRYTSACSGMVYLDELLFENNAANVGRPVLRSASKTQDNSKSPLPRTGGEGQGEGAATLAGNAAEQSAPSSGLTATFSPDAGEKGQVDGLGIQHVFTCEPFSNLVQHNLLIDDGVSFRLERDPAEADAKTDFFASEDRWCRPVMVRTGPEGALWIVDMYRYMIEHPHWLPKEGQDELRPFFRSGDDRGRIYRIVPKGYTTPKPELPNRRVRIVHHMDEMTPPQLVAELESPNGWRRDTAQRLLVTTPDDFAVESLENMVRNGERPTARLHALCTLDGLGKRSAAIVETALRDPHPGVRRNAVRLVPTASVPLTSLLSMTKDPDAKVRLELACVAGQFNKPPSGHILGELLLFDTDPYLRAAVMSSLNAGNINNTIDRFGALVQGDALEQKPGISKMPGFSSADRDELTSILFEQAASIANDDDLERILLLTIDESNDRLQAWQMKSLAKMLDRLTTRGWSIPEHIDEKHRSWIVEAFVIARRMATDSNEDEILRAAAIPLLLRSSDAPQDRETLKALLTPQTPIALQEVAIRHLGQQADESTADILLSGWSSHSPSLRSQILTVLSSRPAWTADLVQQMESSTVNAAEIDAPMRQRLLTTKDGTIKERLEKLFASGSSVDRKAVLEAFQPVLKLSGDAARGAAIFGKKCTTCHKQGNIGHEVGPNLASLTTRTPESLLTAILDPSAAVEAKYLNFVVATTSGRSVIGMLFTETGSSLTLVAAEGKSESILRTDIEELRSTGKSLMPDGLEKDLSQQDLADIIEYVKTIGK
ncbi:MAG TPA: neutral/alkaline non-lysosomal ceramidase N-terminal domain-containing protein [Planctomycetaceae bacterium]|nr:neutral/alkaline non-lysosomal ceramidase N-terminal domain-containing protein [Planctomycetaceae bacterium]